MSLRRYLKYSKQLHPGLEYELCLPGEPLIYSIKDPVAMRTRPLTYFRNKKFRSIIKCSLPAYHAPKHSLVIVLRLFVTPPRNKQLTPKELRSESIPANYAYELCDYLLSFLEMLKGALFNC
jgi:hypothetical protein